MSLILEWAAIGLAITCAGLSVYGWAFHFSVGPAHGGGAEVGLVAGVLAVAFLVVAVVADRRRGR
jgi:hypothetical protein